MKLSQKVFIAKRENYSEILSFILAEAGTVGLSENLTLQFAVEEIVINIINYAYPTDLLGNLEVRCWSDKERFYLQFIDRGIEFNPLSEINKPDTASLEDIPIGGLGIFLTTNLLDEMSYKRENGKNMLQLSLKRD